MKEVWAIIIGILVIFGVSQVKAGELDDLVADKLVEYNGSCRFDKNDMLVFTNSPDNKVVKCLVGFEPQDPNDKKFVLVYDHVGPAFLLEYSKVRKAQRVIWKRGSI